MDITAILANIDRNVYRIPASPEANAKLLMLTERGAFLDPSRATVIALASIPGDVVDRHATALMISEELANSGYQVGDDDTWRLARGGLAVVTKK